MTDFEARSAKLAKLRAEGKASVTYTLEINEEQRLALLDVLRSLPSGFAAGDGQPLEYWDAMLDGLPAIEAEHPGIVHGFCL